MEEKQLVEIIIAPICYGIIALYHVLILIIGIIRPKTVQITRNISTRVNWVLEMMFSKNREQLTIQTVRNHIYAASLLASFSSALAFYFTTTVYESEGNSPIEYKIQMNFLIIVLFISFTLFANSVRLMFHVEFLILARDMTHVKTRIEKNFDQANNDRFIPETFIDLNLPNIGVLDREKLMNVEKAKRNTVLASIFYTLGVRGLFICAPMAFWNIFGIWALLGMSIALLIFCIFYDFL
eukprot:gene4997-8595_t